MKLPKRVKPIIVFLTGIAVFIASLYLANNILRIKSVRIEGGKGMSVKGLDEFLGKNLLFLDSVSVRKKIYDENPELASVSVAKKYPSTLSVRLEKTVPIAALAVQDGFLYLSSGSRLISKSDRPGGLPTITFYQNLGRPDFRPGETLDFIEIKSALYFIQKFGELNLPLRNLDIKGDNMLVCNLNDGRVLVLSSEKEKEEQYYYLRRIVRQFKIEGRDFKSLDLRFDKPILKY